MTRIEQAYNDSLKMKYGVDKLETELTRTPGAIDLDTPTPQAKLYQEYHRNMVERVGMDSLQLEGRLHERVQQSLADAVRLHDRSEALGFKLSCASIPYKGQVQKLWFEISL